MEDIKLSLFTEDMFQYTKDPKDSTKNLLYLISTYGKVAGNKLNIQKSVPLLYTNNEQAE
jgi:hypothetical protein